MKERLRAGQSQARSLEPPDGQGWLFMVSSPRGAEGQPGQGRD